MEYILTRQNQSFLVYSQGPALYLTALPLIAPIRPAPVARDFKDHLICHTHEPDLLFLYESTNSQIVLLFHNPDTGNQRHLPLLSLSSHETLQDFSLVTVQNRLYFFYSAYTPDDGKCRLYYKLPLEQLESTPIEELRAPDMPMVMEGKAPAHEPAPKAEEESTAQLDQNVIREEAPETPAEKQKAEKKEAPDEKYKELESTIQRISAQYQELYDYTLALQKEARKWRSLAEMKK